MPYNEIEQSATRLLSSGLHVQSSFKGQSELNFDAMITLSVAVLSFFFNGSMTVTGRTFFHIEGAEECRHASDNRMAKNMRFYESLFPVVHKNLLQTLWLDRGHYFTVMSGKIYFESLGIVCCKKSFEIIS